MRTNAGAQASLLTTGQCQCRRPAKRVSGSVNVEHEFAETGLDKRSHLRRQCMCHNYRYALHWHAWLPLCVSLFRTSSPAECAADQVRVGLP